jgi:hypothetical protein
VEGVGLCECGPQRPRRFGEEEVAQVLDDRPLTVGGALLAHVLGERSRTRQNLAALGQDEVERVPELGRCSRV